MAIRDNQKQSTLGIIPGIKLEQNPFAQTQGTATILRNVINDSGRLMRKPFSPKWQAQASLASGRVWDMVTFKFYRSSAPRTEFLRFQADGKVYKSTGGCEQEIFPGITSFGILVRKPLVRQLSNRLFFSDGVSSYVYDGRTIQKWGMAVPNVAPSTSAIGAGSLTMATGLKAAVTAVVLDEAGNRVHESSRSPLADLQILAAEDLRIDKSSVTLDSRATHWSGYASELDGSGILRRTNTTAIVTDTFDVTALPAATIPKAPTLNDAPPATTVGDVAENRIIMRDDSNPNKYWWTAMGEVQALSNGAPDESVPGHGSSSISPITNQDFVDDREIRAIVRHQNFTMLFTEARDYALVGTLSLIDNRAPRDLNKLKQFDLGTTGQEAALSLPFGVVWFTPGRKLVLWTSGTNLLDIGKPIQQALDTIPADELDKVSLHWWDGNERQWLMMVVHCADGETQDTTTLANRIFIYDFSLPVDERNPGSWFEWDDITATVIRTHQADDGSEVLLIGDTNGDIYQGDVVASPAHLSRSMILGKTYAGATVQSNPACDIRTGLIMPGGDRWVVGQNISILTGDQDAPGVPSAGSFTEPTLSSWINPLDVGSPGTALTLSLGSAESSGDKDAWLLAETSGPSSGAYAKQFLFQASWAAGVDASGEADGRETARVNTLYKQSFKFRPVSELTE